MPWFDTNAHDTWDLRDLWQSLRSLESKLDDGFGHWLRDRDADTPHLQWPSGEPVSGTFITPLAPANNSGALGFARLTLNGTTLTVDAVVSGLTPGEAHPFHIHGFLDDRASRTPITADDLDRDGFVETPEAQAFAIGPVLAALTTSDVIALAPNATDFPVADENGNLIFNKTYELDPNNPNDALILDELRDRTEGRAIEFHGISLPEGEGDGTPYEVNGTGGYIPMVPAIGGILTEAEGAFGELVASLTQEEFNEAALTIVTALRDPSVLGEEADSTDTYFTIIAPANNSGVTGAAVFTFDEENGTFTVAVEAEGLTPGEHHPLHIHAGFEPGTPVNLPPPIALDADLDGFVETPEVEPPLGPVVLPITASGEVASEEDLEDYPTADENGTLSFEQTYEFDLSDQNQAFVFEQLQDQVAGRFLAIHGLDVPEGAGAGSLHEINGTGGYIPIAPAAGGFLLPLDESNPILTALLQDQGLLI